MKRLIESDIENLSDDLLEDLDIDDVSDKNVSVFISDRDKIKVQDEFVMLFASNLQKLIVNDKITMREMKVLLTIAKFTQFKNVFNVTQRVLADDAKITPSAVSQVMKKLKAKGLVLHDSQTGVDFLNPYLFLKGSIKEFKKSSIAKQLRFKEFDMDEDIKNPF